MGEKKCKRDDTRMKKKKKSEDNVNVKWKVRFKPWTFLSESANSCLHYRKAFGPKSRPVAVIYTHIQARTRDLNLPASDLLPTADKGRKYVRQEERPVIPKVTLGKQPINHGRPRATSSLKV